MLILRQINGYVGKLRTLQKCNMQSHKVNCKLAARLGSAMDKNIAFKGNQTEVIYCAVFVTIHPAVPCIKDGGVRSSV